jgi:hypothetical protein
MEGALALQCGEDAVLLRQRPEGLVLRFLLGQERRHLQIRDGDGRAVLPEAVEKLASEAGVTLPKITHEAQVQEEKRKGLHEVVELAARFFEAELMGDRGAGARRYLSGRGLEGEARKAFRIGYGPPDRFACAITSRARASMPR